MPRKLRSVRRADPNGYGYPKVLFKVIEGRIQGDGMSYSIILYINADVLQARAKQLIQNDSSTMYDRDVNFTAKARLVLP